MTGVVTENCKKAFNWIYDCGSKSRNAMDIALTRTLAWPEWSDPINMLTLSHFDDDHVNGLEALLFQRGVNFLVLPFSEWQQRVREVAIGGLKGVSASTALLQLSPVAWLQSKGLVSRVGALLLVRGGASGQKGNLDPMPLLTDTNPDKLRPEKQQQESQAQLDLSMIATDHSGAPSVQVIQHGTPIHPDAFPMEFMFYNAELSGKDLGIIDKSNTGALISKKSRLPLQDARKAIEQAISALGLNRPPAAWHSRWRDNLKKCYESHFGSSGAAKNNISLCMYVAPKLSASNLEPCYLFHNHNASPPVGNFYAGHSFLPNRPALLCTGDLRLDACVISAMKSHFGLNRWGRIGVTQVPHHGSKHSWVNGNANLLNPSIFVHCAPGRGVHPHANVIADLAGKIVFTADYQNSVHLKYHFLD